MLSERIARMAAHLAANAGDADCKRRLTMATVARRKVLSYMQRRDFSGYRLAVREMGLRPLPVFHSAFLPKVSVPPSRPGRAILPPCLCAALHRALSAPAALRRLNHAVSVPPPSLSPSLSFPSPHPPPPQVRLETHKTVNSRNAKLKNRVGRGWAGH